ncbi:hypothetical protein Gotur_032326, partial [Gossypium turneri]
MTPPVTITTLLRFSIIWTGLMLSTTIASGWGRSLGNREIILNDAVASGFLPRTPSFDIHRCFFMDFGFLAIHIDYFIHPLSSHLNLDLAIWIVNLFSEFWSGGIICYPRLKRFAVPELCNMQLLGNEVDFMAELVEAFHSTLEEVLEANLFV